MKQDLPLRETLPLISQSLVLKSEYPQSPENEIHVLSMASTLENRPIDAGLSMLNQRLVPIKPGSAWVSLSAASKDNHQGIFILYVLAMCQAQRALQLLTCSILSNNPMRYILLFSIL